MPSTAKSGNGENDGKDMPGRVILDPYSVVNVAGKEKTVCM